MKKTKVVVLTILILIGIVVPLSLGYVLVVSGLRTWTTLLALLAFAVVWSRLMTAIIDWLSARGAVNRAK